MYMELHSKHCCYIETNLPQSSLWLVSVMNTCIFYDWLVPEQFVILFISKRIIIYITLKLFNKFIKYSFL